MKQMILMLVLGILCGSGWAFNGDMGIGTEPLTNGSAAYPWLIEDLADFDVFAGNSAYWAAGVHTRLMTDIDLSGRTYTAAVIAPDTDTMNYGYQGTPYKGTFNGNNRIITHLTMIGLDDCGLFGSIGKDGSVHNIRMESTDVSGRYRVGGLCGNNSQGDITACYVRSKISGDSRVGGLCGDNYGGTIQDCCAISIVNGTENVGGLSGSNWYMNPSRQFILYAYIINCYAAGVVEGTGDYIGGLCGYNYSILRDCYAICDVSGNYMVGGLCGANLISLDFLFQEGRIQNCYSAGSVSGADYTGGLCGGSYSIASILGCYFLVTAGVDNGYGFPLSDGLMKQQSSFTGWDFVDDWMMLREGEDYPRLAWQEVYSGDIAGLYGVDMVDFAYLADYWGLDCDTADCGRADIDQSGDVGVGDLAVVANDWLCQ